jgi:hypothetical protein
VVCCQRRGHLAPLGDNAFSVEAMARLESALPRMKTVGNPRGNMVKIDVNHIGECMDLLDAPRLILCIPTGHSNACE